MGYVRVHRILGNIGSGSTGDYVFGTRGGILIGLKLISIVNEYYNLGTENELAKAGDLICVVGDSGTSNPILGQTLGTDFIRIPVGGAFEWQHPFAEEIKSAAVVISKLGYYSFTPMPIGVIQSALRIIAARHATITADHHLQIEADLISFDSSIA